MTKKVVMRNKVIKNKVVVMIKVITGMEVMIYKKVMMIMMVGMVLRRRQGLMVITRILMIKGLDQKTISLMMIMLIYIVAQQGTMHMINTKEKTPHCPIQPNPLIYKVRWDYPLILVKNEFCKVVRYKCENCEQDIYSSLNKEGSLLVKKVGKCTHMFKEF